MITQCPDCRQRMNTKDVRVHRGNERCRAGRLTFELYARGLRPYPNGHGMPVFVESFAAVTRGAYEGHPREAMPLKRDPVEQHWFPWWADIINELWVGAIDQRGALEKASRDALMFKIQSEWNTRQKMMICQAFHREGLKGARELVSGLIIGDKPELIEEFEARVARLAGG